MRLIDVDKLRESISKTTWYHIFKGKLIQGANGETDIPLYKASDIYSVLDAAPTVDAVPVVRCEDCENRKKTEIDWGICLDSADAYHEPMRRYDDFCSYGERKDGE